MSSVEPIKNYPFVRKGSLRVNNWPIIEFN